MVDALGSNPSVREGVRVQSPRRAPHGAVVSDGRNASLSRSGPGVRFPSASRAAYPAVRGLSRLRSVSQRERITDIWSVGLGGQGRLILSQEDTGSTPVRITRGKGKTVSHLAHNQEVWEMRALLPPPRPPERIRLQSHSSVGESASLIMKRSGVQIPLRLRKGARGDSSRRSPQPPIDAGRFDEKRRTLADERQRRRDRRTRRSRSLTGNGLFPVGVIGNMPDSGSGVLGSSPGWGAQAQKRALRRRASAARGIAVPWRGSLDHQGRHRWAGQRAEALFQDQGHSRG